MLILTNMSSLPFVCVCVWVGGWVGGLVGRWGGVCVCVFNIMCVSRERDLFVAYINEEAISLQLMNYLINQ